MMEQPHEIELTSHVNEEWLQKLRWLNRAHYELEVGMSDLRTNCRAMVNGHFLFRLIPSVLSSRERQEFFRLSLAVARNKASGARRLKNVGSGEHTLTVARSPSVYARPRKLVALRDAKEGVFGFEGAGRGGGCRPCSFNAERPALSGTCIALRNP